MGIYCYDQHLTLINKSISIQINSFKSNQKKFIDVGFKLLIVEIHAIIKHLFMTIMTNDSL